MSLALVGFAAICLSAFNKMFIFNTLFPHYDAERPPKLHLTVLARILCCDYFGSNHSNDPNGLEAIEKMEKMRLPTL